ncbi:MAG: deoxynucleoside kinase [Chitinophagales bacterium]
MTSNKKHWIANLNFVVVEGNTGAGKTSLAKLLAQEFAANLVLETFAENPFLPKFYADSKRYGFTNELYFMLDRNEHLRELLSQNAFSTGLTFSDYVLHKSLLYAQSNLDEDEITLFQRVFQLIYGNLPKPDLIIYVHSNVPRLIENIKKRGRDFEQVVKPEYLKKMENTYFRYFEENPDLKVIILHTDNVDFVNKPQDYQKILDVISGQAIPEGITHYHF